MKKAIISAAFLGGMLFSSSSSFAQLQDEKDVTITMDLQPILQLDMTTTDQLEFIFDDIRDYYSGITKYAATVLRVSASVNWDLYAVGMSTGNTAAGFWDQQISYSSTAPNANAIDQLPLSLVELHQSNPNNGAASSAAPFIDYSAQFPVAATGVPAVYTPAADNSLYADATGNNVAPGATAKYIAGQMGTAAGEQIAGGSWLTSGAGVGSDYYYIMDYRILPGLPAIFPNAFDGATQLVQQDLATVNTPESYAEPGVYTMHVKYVLLEDQ